MLFLKNDVIIDVFCGGFLVYWYWLFKVWVVKFGLILWKKFYNFKKVFLKWMIIDKIFGIVLLYYRMSIFNIIEGIWIKILKFLFYVKIILVLF